MFCLHDEEGDVIDQDKKRRLPDRITEEWLEEVFAPLTRYLEKHHAADASRIAEYLMFMNNEEDLYLYKNRLSFAQIAFDPQGGLLYCQEEALRYRYSWSPDSEEEVCAAKEELAVHENVTRWIDANLSSRVKEAYESDVARFLQELWGPLTDYRFEGLTADSSVRPLSLNASFYLYADHPRRRLAFEFLSSAIVEARKQEALRRRRELLAEHGWTIMTMARDHLERHLPVLRERLRYEWKLREREG